MFKFRKGNETSVEKNPKYIFNHKLEVQENITKIYENVQPTYGDKKLKLRKGTKRNWTSLQTVPKK